MCTLGVLHVPCQGTYCGILYQLPARLILWKIVYFFHNIYFHSIMAEKSNTVKKTSSCNICAVDLGCYPETRNIKLIRLVGTLEDGLMPSSPTYFRIIHYLDDTVVAIQIRSGYYRRITYADDILVMHEYHHI